MKKLLLLAFCLFSLRLAAQWQAFTPNIPDTVGIQALDAVDEHTAWAVAIKYFVDSAGYQPAGSDKGYYVRTTDGGATWSAGILLMGQVPSFSNVSAIHADTAWVAGLDYGDFSNHLVRTVDGGQTWTPQLTEGFQQPTSYINFVHFWDAQNGIACGDPSASDTDTTLFFEIWRTGDGGQTWARVPAANIPPSLPDEYGLAASFSAHGQYIWFTTSSYSATPVPGRVFRSADKGLHWEVFETGLHSLVYFSFADTSRGAVATFDFTIEELQLQVTQDGGATWTDAVLPDKQHKLASLVAVPGSGFLVLVYFDDPVSGPFVTMLSKDMGATWQQIGSGELAGWAAFAGPTAGYAGEWQPVDHATRMYRYNGSPLSGLLSGQALQAELSGFPNPVSDRLTVRVKTVKPADFLLLLNDAQGHLLRQQSADPGRTEWATTVDVQDLPAGTYFLTITCAEGSAQQTVVKM
ncbi:MAG: T9SS type A sorting domain-containing protein [Saprospiraceae bacterium]|nr:T9SS type A sorting domain-containing protein [Saprospiraceae bacterium]